MESLWLAVTDVCRLAWVSSLGPAGGTVGEEHGENAEEFRTCQHPLRWAAVMEKGLFSTVTS